MGLLIFFVLLAILSSFAASIMEGTLLSVSNSYIQDLINKGKKSGKLLWEFKQNIDRPLSAILTFDTIASVVGATGAGAQAEEIFKSPGIGIFTAIFTLASLIFAEIIPKTIGAIYWRKTAGVTAYILKPLIFLMSPFIFFTNLITKIITRKKLPEDKLLREEIAVMAQIGLDAGALNDFEKGIIANLLNLHKTKISKILTPRTVILAFPKNITIKEVIENENLLPFSRIPVYNENIDKIEGMVFRHEILNRAATCKPETKIEEIMQPIHSIPGTLSVAEALKLFLNRKEHMFVALDEYGGTMGIITLEDAVESLLGAEIVDEKDLITNMQEIAIIRSQVREIEREKLSETKNETD